MKKALKTTSRQNKAPAQSRALDISALLNWHEPKK